MARQIQHNVQARNIQYDNFASVNIFRKNVKYNKLLFKMRIKQVWLIFLQIKCQYMWLNYYYLPIDGAIYL